MMSKNPSLSKSSTIAPPALLNLSRPRDGATSTNLPMSQRRRDIHKPADVFVRFECCRWNQMLSGNLARVFSQSHVGEVEQPSDFEILRLLSQVFEEVFNGVFGVRRRGLPAFGAERKDAALIIMVMRAMFDLGSTEVRDPKRLFEEQLYVVDAIRHGQAMRRLEMAEGPVQVALVCSHLRQQILHIDGRNEIARAGLLGFVLL